MDRKELGELGEKIACEYLVKKGYEILCKNYRINFGEIDIVAQKKHTIHFVEVKSLLSKTGLHAKRSEGHFPEQRVDWKKQKKLRGLAEIWLNKNNVPQNYPYQIDVIGILVDETGRIARLHFFGNVVSDK